MIDLWNQADQGGARLTLLKMELMPIHIHPLLGMEPVLFQVPTMRLRQI